MSMRRFVPMFGVVSVVSTVAGGCARYDANLVVNPVIAATRMTIAENIERDGSLGFQTGFVSLYVAEIGQKRYLALVSDDREEGENVRAILLESRFRTVADSLEVTVLGEAGRSLVFSIPGASLAAATTAKESFSTIDLEFVRRDGRVVELRFDLDLDDDDGDCVVEHSIRTSRGVLGLFAGREEERELRIVLSPTRAGRSTELWMGTATPAPTPPSPAKPAADGSKPVAPGSSATGAPPKKSPSSQKSPTQPSTPSGKKTPLQGAKDPAGNQSPTKSLPAGKNQKQGKPKGAEAAEPTGKAGGSGPR